MNREEFEGKWDPGEDKVQAKWGKLTRAERTVLSGRRSSHYVKLHKLYGISEEEAAWAIALEDSRVDEPQSSLLL
jgi:uncharacterized protein YjbJ (UPF0337 family)